MSKKDLIVNEAVILLGGMGTRLLPYTKSVPKEMLPVYDVPAIFLLVEEAYLSGIKKIIFVITKHNKRIIESFFNKDEYLDNFLKDKPDKKKQLDRINKVINSMEFKYVHQNIKGTFGALYAAKKEIKNDNFIVMYGDDLIDSTTPLTKSLINEFKNDTKMYVSVQEKSMKYLPNVGVVKLDKNNHLLDLVEKDKNHSNCELHGRMLLNKDIFKVKNLLRKHDNDEYYLSYALLKFKGQVKAFKYHGEYFNLGEKDGYIKASIHYALKNNKRDSLLEFIRKEIK